MELLNSTLNYLDLVNHFFLVPAIFLGLIGLILGSYLGSMTYRLPLRILDNSSCYINSQEETVELKYLNLHPQIYDKARSYCPHCKKMIKFYHNIPLLSFLLLKGKSACCDLKISKRYFFIEMLMMVLSFVIGYIYLFSIESILLLVISFYCVALGIIDKEHFLLPDQLTLTLLWGGIGLSLLGLTIRLEDSVLAVIIGYSSLWSVNYIYYKIRKFNGIGFGDMKYFAAIGAWVGLDYLFYLLSFSAILAIVVALLKYKSSRMTEVPFGVYLSISFWLAMVILNQQSA